MSSTGSGSVAFLEMQDVNVGLSFADRRDLAVTSHHSDMITLKNLATSQCSIVEVQRVTVRYGARLAI